jgi:hypothetical protein
LLLFLYQAATTSLTPFSSFSLMPDLELKGLASSRLPRFGAHLCLARQFLLGPQSGRAAAVAGKLTVAHHHAILLVFKHCWCFKIGKQLLRKLTIE